MLLWFRHFMTPQIAEAYGVHVVEGVLSHQLKQFVIDGNKVRLAKAALHGGILVESSPSQVLANVLSQSSEFWKLAGRLRKLQSHNP